MSELNGILAQAAEDVLENMFFSGVMGEMELPAGGQRVCARVAFQGTSTGELGVSTPRSTAAALAAGFLGAEDEEIGDSQVQAVVGELANVLCGAVLGRMTPEGHFTISPPEVSDGEDGTVVGDRALQLRFELIEGDLSVGLTVD